MRLESSIHPQMFRLMIGGTRTYAQIGLQKRYSRLALPAAWALEGTTHLDSFLLNATDHPDRLPSVVRSCAITHLL